MPSKKSVVNVAEVDLSDAEILCSGRRSHRFSDWETTEVEPRPGVYTVWDKPDGEQERFVYVGMAGRGVLATDLDAPDEPKRKRGLHGRLKAHASGKRSGDQFCVYVCDYFVVPTLGDDEHRKIAAWQLYLDDLTQDYIHATFAYRFIYTADGKTAHALESRLRKGHLTELGQPFLNPLPGRKKRRPAR